MNSDNPPIIVARDHKEIYLWSIGRRLMHEDEVKIHVIDKHLSKAEDIIRMLRKSFGILEMERRRVDTLNAVCIFNDGGKCTNPDASFQGVCNDSIRVQCDHYKAKYTKKFEVNEIKLEKIAAIKSL